MIVIVLVDDHVVVVAVKSHFQYGKLSRREREGTEGCREHDLYACIA